MNLSSPMILDIIKESNLDFSIHSISSEKLEDPHFWKKETRMLEFINREHDSVRAVQYGMQLLNAIEKNMSKTSNHFQIAIYLITLARIQLSTGIVDEQLEKILNLAESSVVKLESTSVECREKMLDELYLLRAVYYKSKFRVDESLYAIEQLLSNKIHIQYPDRFIMSKRQRVMMLQDEKEYDRLYQESILYCNRNRLEYYRTNKRVFEFLLNSKMITEARAIYKRFFNSYLDIQVKATPIMAVSFAKDVAYFYAMVGNKLQANFFLKVAYKSAEKNLLYGQLRQISILESFVNDGVGKLETFRS